MTTKISDPLLNGTKPCGICDVAGQITWSIEQGYECGACGGTDNDYVMKPAMVIEVGEVHTVKKDRTA